MPEIIERRDWGAKAPTRAPIDNPPGERRGVVLHFDGPIKGHDADLSTAAGRSYVHAIQNWHQDHNGWSDIAYSYLVLQSGDIFQGRGLRWDQFGNGRDVVGADDGTDRMWYTIMWGGGDGGNNSPNRDRPTDEALASIRWLINYLRSHGAGMRVLPHNDFKVKTCPGAELSMWADRWDRTDLTEDDTPTLPPPDDGVITELEATIARLEAEVTELERIEGALRAQVGAARGPAGELKRILDVVVP
jgi:hypothetical protein